MTKLKRPITLTVETVEDAVRLRIALNVPESTLISTEPDKNVPPHPMATSKNSDSLNPRRKIEEQLASQGIDWNAWLPAPFKIADRECTFQPNGTVRFSCGATITEEEIQEFLERRNAAMGIGSWPKYYLSHNHVVWRWRHINDCGHCWKNGHWNTSVKSSFNHSRKPENWTPITPEEAAAIVGTDNFQESSPPFGAGTGSPGSVISWQKPPETAGSIAASSDLFEALKSLFEAVRQLRSEANAMESKREAARSALLKTAR
jgi:hypothetical protein